MVPSPASASVLLPTLNEEEYILECIDSLLMGMEDQDRHEILVIDGGSKDKTLEIVASNFGSLTNIRVIENPKKIVSAALNIGAREATHDYLIWCGSHARYAPGYVDKSVAIHLTQHCGSSGGVLRAIAKNQFGELVAACTSSKFSGGGAAYRHTKEITQAKSVFGGCFTKQAFLAVGGLDENWVRNQDVEFNARIRDRIGPIIIDPSIVCEYYCRDSLQGLISQNFQYGYWRFRTSLRHPDTFAVKLLAPVLLTLSLMITSILSVTHSSLFLVPVAAYFIVCLLVALLATDLNNKTPYKAMSMALIFSAIHLSWGAGFLWSLIDSNLAKIKSTLKQA